MRKLIIVATFAICIILQSCSPKLMPRTVTISFFDFRKFTNEGFFLSPDPYTGEFTPCGELLIIVHPADIKYSDINKGKNLDDAVYSSPNSIGGVTKEDISSEELLEMIVAKAKSVGANGIANFKCLSISYTNYIQGSPHTYFSHYEICGFAIKRTK